MRTIYILVTVLLCLNIGTNGQAQILDKMVSLKYTEVTVGEVLKDLSKKHNINFSYSNNVVPLTKKVSLTVNEKPLSYVLQELFKGTDITYEAIGSQIVLKKGIKKSSKADEKVITPVSTDASIPETDTSVFQMKEDNDDNVQLTQEAVYARQDTVLFFPEEARFEKLPVSDTADRATLRRQYQQEKRKLRQKYNRKMDSLDRTGNIQSKETLKEEFKRVSDKLKSVVNNLQDSLSTLKIPRVTLPVKDSLQVKDSTGLDTGKPSDSVHRPVQVTFIPPMGTNGRESGKIVNHLSFNILAGTAAGLEGFEFGGLVNVENKYVHGAQFAGLGNVAGHNVRGSQFSGLFNINGGYTRGGQFSGFMNVVADSANAVQGAGFMNTVGNNCTGVQLAGFTNVVSGSMKGVQSAGFLNVTAGDLDGAQLAGFMNIADSVKGAQVSGFLNIAGKVKGSQIGFINIADTVTGAQIGFISFGGYRKLELFVGETLYGNIAFKTGSANFYNIFAAGIKPEKSFLTYGFGYGFGSEVKLSSRAIANIDLIGYSMHQEKINFHNLNILGQFRPTFGYLITSRISLFAGPVFNVLVTDEMDPVTGEYGSSVTPKGNLYDVTEDGVNVSMWLGFNAGIRF